MSMIQISTEDTIQHDNKKRKYNMNFKEKNPKYYENPQFTKEEVQIIIV